MRAVFDVNVLVAALLSGSGTPAGLLRRWEYGEFELIGSPLLFDELARVLAYPKIRKRISADEARVAIEWLRRSMVVMNDPADQPIAAPDPNDDYLVALASYQRAMLVTGDNALLSLKPFPVVSPQEFMKMLLH